MTRIAITGASGFIGKELSAILRSHGNEVIELSRSGHSPGHIRWQLGNELPSNCADAKAMVHLASAALLEASKDATNLDFEGTRLLIEQVRRFRQDGHPHRFIFLSSQSARPNAVNAYGRSKWSIECMLDQADEIVVRPGLVYGDPPASVFAMFDKLARLPVVPIVSDRKSIQPIHVRELAECVAQLVSMEHPPKLTKLGAVEPLTFREALRIAAYRAGRSSPFMMSIPDGPVRLICRGLDKVFCVNLTERLDGLTGLEPLDTESSLRALDRTLRPFDQPPSVQPPVGVQI
jgi:nucleoside-diphosphate-sugar epimerase